ncbi:glycoside hydrolase family 28 protein [Neptunitalea lumnitzerae]|uniref:Polygalacturonase n=1 Tax=Neptunitalea lumnitzerae TaxID=2965509 RepID=A0ABQ5MIU3_9FLAO|nr:glycoside hydrolase family 28 protein [Neptunitalea sp. Y10]GLB49341.1 polygalacturonase [Neptunitalea sp. Y10]
MKKILYIIGLAFIILNSCNTPTKTNKLQTVVIDTTKIETPFGKVEIQSPTFKNASKFNITNFGAEINNKEATTKAIAQAIDMANEAKGGIVIIPKGTWITKKIHLKSNVNLHLKEGATLAFSSEPNDYLPPVHTTWEGMECYNYSPLIYAYECKNVAITGKGTLKAQMDTWKIWFARPAPHMNSLKRLYTLASTGIPVEERQMVNDSAHLRPQFIQFNRCENVKLEGISIKDSPFWVIHPYMSKNVTIRNVNVFAHGHNNDGVDPEMSENVLIEDCIFDQGDDAIAIKSGRNQDAWRLNSPTKNVIFRNCIVKNGHQLVAIGSELSGGIENVFVDNCVVEEGAKLNHLLFIKTNERRGGYVKNMYVQNVSSGHIDKGILGIETDVLYQWRDLVPTYEKRLTPISNIYLTNVKAEDVKFVSRISAQSELPVTNVSLRNVEATNVTEQLYINENVENFSIE